MRFLLSVLLCVLSLSCHCLVPAAQCDSVLTKTLAYSQLPDSLLVREDIGKLLRFAPTYKTILLVGESGSGKSRLVAAMARQKRHLKAPFLFISDKPSQNTTNIPRLNQYLKNSADANNNADFIKQKEFKQALYDQIPDKSLVMFDLHIRDFGAEGYSQDLSQITVDMGTLARLCDLADQARRFNGASTLITMSKFIYDRMKTTPIGKAFLTQVQVIEL